MHTGDLSPESPTLTNVVIRKSRFIISNSFTSLSILIFALTACLLTGCGPKISDPNMQALKIETEMVGPVCEVAALLQTAQNLKGIPYKYGGNTPKTGFDCSGYVRWVFAENGVDMPRTASEQMAAGAKTSWGELQPGDLVFFKLKRGKRRIMHVGIYTGEGKMIHSPSRGKTVSEEIIDKPYWTNSFIGARRVIESSLP